jgi:hypothetical protein
MPVPGAQSTVQDLIKSALRSLGVLAQGEEPSAAESQDALVIFNQMVDTLNADSLNLFSETMDEFALSAAKQTYTYGPGGDFNKPRPTYIDRASIVILSNPQQPLEFPIPIYTTQQWQEQVPIKNTPGNLPLLIYDDCAYPLRNITFWPFASDNTHFRSYTWQKLTQGTNLSTIIALPEGYAEMLKTNLAVRLAPEYQASVHPVTAMLAISTLATIKAANADDVQLHSDLTSSNTPSKMRSELFNIP